MISKALSALIDIPINRYSVDTLTHIRSGVDRWRQEFRKGQRDVDSPFARDADIYFINAGLSEIDDASEQQDLMKIPTTMYLTDEQVDRLLVAAARLIRQDPDFRRLMRDLEQERPAQPR